MARDTWKEQQQQPLSLLSTLPSVRKEDYLGVLQGEYLVPASNLSGSHSLVNKHEAPFQYAENINQMIQLCVGKLKALKEREEAKFVNIVSDAGREDLLLDILALVLYTLASNLVFKMLLWVIKLPQRLAKKALASRMTEKRRFEIDHVSSKAPNIVVKDQFSVKTSVRYLQESP
jgi:hypothetical protein